MNITDLIEQLQEIHENYGDIEVRLATQPNWPFADEVAGVAVDDPSENINGFEEEDEEPRDGEVIAYIGQGSQIEYLSGHAKKSLQNSSVWY